VILNEACSAGTLISHSRNILAALDFVISLDYSRALLYLGLRGSWSAERRMTADIHPLLPGPKEPLARSE